MAQPFKLHGKQVGDDALSPWVSASIARSLFYFGEAIACRATRAASAICAYYCLFHLGLFLMLSCPRYLEAAKRKKIQEGLSSDMGDATRYIKHGALLDFLEGAERANNALPADVRALVCRAKNVREELNYGLRVSRDPDLWGITCQNCEPQPCELDRILADLPRILEITIKWAHRNAEENGFFVVQAIDEAGQYFAGESALYGGWCSAETGRVAEQMRQTLRSRFSAASR